jgi:hypothetical protein
MAHFVELDQTNTVKRCLVVNDDYILQNGIEVEQLGIDHLKSVYGEDTIWKQTSYNNNMRVRFGRVGYTYDETLDAFVPTKPYPSWVLNQTTVDWEPPLPRPDDENAYTWNEETVSWDLVEFPKPE